jgi:hypothetical protein
VLNADLWKRLVRAIKNAGHRVEFEWVQGHSKDLHNRAVDKMAKGSAKSTLRTPLSVVSVRRKWTGDTLAYGGLLLLGGRLADRLGHRRTLLIGAIGFVCASALSGATKVRAADRVEVLIAGRERVVEVVRPIESRVGALVAATCYADHSPPVVPEAGPGIMPMRGEGRPSKRLRRELERLRRAADG